MEQNSSNPAPPPPKKPKQTQNSPAVREQNAVEYHEGQQQQQKQPRLLPIHTQKSSVKEGPHVRVGVGVLVKDPSSPSAVFAGRRKGSHGAGTLSLPGGHLEMFESWEDTAIREVKEEMDLELDRASCKFAHVTNDIMKPEGKHYVTIFMMATCKDDSASPKNKEPDKCEGWKSYSWEELKREQNLFGPLQKLLEAEPGAVLEFMCGK